jgi:hypothetical protein
VIHWPNTSNAILLAAFSLAALQSQAAITSLAPTPARVPGCREAQCVPFSSNARVCKCIAEETAEFELESDGRVVSRWSAGMNGTHPAFAARTVDLDGDGSQELVVENLDAVSNGMAVFYWTIAILDSKFASPLLFEASDWAGGCIRASPGKKGTLLSTAWSSSSEPARGDGLYFVGRSFSYVNGMLVPALDTPVTVRRYLFSFERERGRTLNTGDEIPVRWLQHPSAQPRERDPILPSPAPTEWHGTIVGVRQDPDEDCWHIELETARGRQSVDYPECRHEYTGVTAVEMLGDNASGRLFPHGYRPADSSRLVGQQTMLSTYRYDGCRGEACPTFTILWIGAPPL